MTIYNTLNLGRTTSYGSSLWFSKCLAGDTTTPLPLALSLPSPDTVNIWDEGPDSDANFHFDKKRGVVVAASFNKLVERITSSKDHGEEDVLRLERRVNWTSST